MQPYTAVYLHGSYAICNKYPQIDEKNNTITWNIELIDNKSSFNLSYDAYINNNANTNKVFSTHLTLKSNIVDTITSNNTSIYSLNAKVSQISEEEKGVNVNKKDSIIWIL